MVVHDELHTWELNIENIRNSNYYYNSDRRDYIGILIYILLFYPPLINNLFHAGFNI